jgi:TfoX N-terminal domain
LEIPKPTTADRDRFVELVPDSPDVEPMFGNLGGFVNGNMFMGLFGAAIGVKLGAADRDELLTYDGAGPFGPPGRPMGGYVTIPGTWGSSEAAPWAERALAEAASLPPKISRKRP